MNSYDLFRKLTKGISFDRRRFSNDLQKIGVQKKNDANQNTLVFQDTMQKEEEDFHEVEVKHEEEKIEHVGVSEFKQEEEEHQEEINEEESDIEGTDEEDEEEEMKIQLMSDRKIEKKKKKEINRVEELDAYLEEVNKKRTEHGIAVWGNDIPEPVSTFDELKERHKIMDELLSNLLNQGYTAPTPIQMQSWPLMLQGREILGCAPTGSGKTAAFVLPILNQLGGPRKKGFRAVILAPTRELAKQTYRECSRLTEGLGMRVHIITNVNYAKVKFGLQSSKRFDILVTTPKRLVYLLKEDDTPPLDLSNVEWLVVDESDRLFEGGVEGFRGQLATIYQACTGPKIKRALFSATFATGVERWCKLNLDNVAMVTVGVRNTACKDVKQELMFCGNESGKVLALRDILRKGYEPPVLIFVQTQDRAKDLFKELIYDNIMVEAIHGGRTEAQRDKVVQAFRERKIWVLICTELMARGIDFKGVNLVINYDCPASTINYIHRVGRTGRANHQGQAITFWTMDDKPLLPSIAKVIHDSGQPVPEWMLKLKKYIKENKNKLPQLPDRGYVSQAVMLENQSRRAKKGKYKNRIMQKGKNGIEACDTTPAQNSSKNTKQEKGFAQKKGHNSKNQNPVKNLKRKKSLEKSKGIDIADQGLSPKVKRKRGPDSANEKTKKSIKKQNMGEKNNKKQEPKKSMKIKSNGKGNVTQKVNKTAKKKIAVLRKNIPQNVGEQ